MRATRAKWVRAEPVAALYEQGRVAHRGEFRALEDQMRLMTVTGYRGEGSPDRLDALVWALTELILEPTSTYRNPRVRPL
jgi:phage terminase large subunit-like protein